MNIQEEIDKTPRAVKNGMSQDEYDTWLFLANKPACSEPYTYIIKQSEITAWVANLIAIKELESRIDERENMRFFDNDGTETFTPYCKYRYMGDGLKVDWDYRTTNLEQQLLKLREGK